MQRGDIVIYFCNAKPMIGKIGNIQINGRVSIVPKRGRERAIRNKNKILSLNDLFAKYQNILKGETK